MLQLQSVNCACKWDLRHASILAGPRRARRGLVAVREVSIFRLEFLLVVASVKVGASVAPDMLAAKLQGACAANVGRALVARNLYDLSPRNQVKLTCVSNEIMTYLELGIRTHSGAVMAAY